MRSTLSKHGPHARSACAARESCTRARACSCAPCMGVKHARATPMCAPLGRHARLAARAQSVDCARAKRTLRTRARAQACASVRALSSSRASGARAGPLLRTVGVISSDSPAIGRRPPVTSRARHCWVCVATICRHLRNFPWIAAGEIEEVGQGPSYKETAGACYDSWLQAHRSGSNRERMIARHMTYGSGTRAPVRACLTVAPSHRTPPKP